MFNRKDHAILNALLQGKDPIWVIATYNTDSDHLKAVMQRYEDALSRKKVQPMYELCDNCEIKFKGRQIEYCYQLHGQDPALQDWLEIEDSCLLCLIHQNKHGLYDPKTNLKNLISQVTYFFGRSSDAIYQRIYTILKNNRKPVYLSQEIWEDLTA